MRVLLISTRASAVRPAKARWELSSIETILRIVRGSCSLIVCCWWWLEMDEMER